MNQHKILKNISYSLIGNFVSILGSIIMIIIVPKFMSVDDYGLWQLFLFYFSYIGFLHFGWEDGIYLRYAGKEFCQLDKKLFAGQIYAIIFLQIVLGLLIYIASTFFGCTQVKLEIIGFIAISMVFANFNNCCNFILQITNRIYSYARLMVFEQVILIFFVLLNLFLGFNHYYNLISCKIISLFLASCFGTIMIRDLLRPEFYAIKKVFEEATENIRVGSKLMLANIASMLILGIIRYGISEAWDIATFGKISLTLSISNFLMVFINAISVVFFPILKTIDIERLGPLYLNFRKGISIVFLGLLILYYPLKEMLSLWLPRYADALRYMAILFPICLFESKVSLLINTYLKSLRQETMMMKINILAVILSFLLTFVGILILHNLSFIVFSIVIIFAFRCTLAEYWLCHLLNLHINEDILTDLLFVILFIICSWYIAGVKGVMFYISVYSIYLYLNKKQIMTFINYIYAKNRI